MEASIFASQFRSFSSWRRLFDPEPISWLAYSVILTALLVEVTHICAPVDTLKAFPISQPFVMSERSPSILLVEDEPFVQTLLAAYLEKEGVVVTVASTAAEMRAVLRSPGQPIDAIALDLGLPDEEGLALVRQLRMRLDVPICITTRDDSEASRTVAAELGVDDYLIKPFHPRQLVASLMRLLVRDGEKKALIRFKGWSFDGAARVLTNTQGHPITLTPSEFDVLATLVAAKGRTVSRAHLLDAIASDSGALSRVVDVIVSSLRRKLGDPARSPRLIVTVPSVGYRFCASSE